jgi:hypothetical protein
VRVHFTEIFLSSKKERMVEKEEKEEEYAFIVIL